MTTNRTTPPGQAGAALWFVHDFWRQRVKRSLGAVTGQEYGDFLLPGDASNFPSSLGLNRPRSVEVRQAALGRNQRQLRVDVATAVNDPAARDGMLSLAHILNLCPQALARVTVHSLAGSPLGQLGDTTGLRVHLRDISGTTLVAYVDITEHNPIIEIHYTSTLLTTVEVALASGGVISPGGVDANLRAVQVDRSPCRWEHMGRGWVFIGEGDEAKHLDNLGIY